MRITSSARRRLPRLHATLVVCLIAACTREKAPERVRCSQLTEITTANAKNLRPAWTFSTAVLRGHEEPPIVVNNMMYILTPFPNLLYALDLTKPGAPLKWMYDPKPRSEAQGGPAVTS